MIKIILLIALKLVLCEKIFNINYNEKNSRNISFSPKLNSKKKNLLLSIIIGYSWDKILPFVKSFIRINFRNCDIIFFVNQVSPKVINNLKSYGIHVYLIRDKLYNSTEIYQYRWKLYRDFLNDHKSKYNIVLSVDIRDTIFQKEFFSLYENHEPFIGFSYESANLNKLIYNEWIINTFGYEIFKRISNERTINAGTIWGTSDKFYQFSKIFCNKLSEYPEAIDQTLLNYLIYHDKMLSDCINIKSDEYGNVLTLGLTKRDNINLDGENNILNFKREVVAIVHQYDRHPDLKKIMRNKFCPELTYDKYIIQFFVMLELFTILLLIKSNITSFKIKNS